jgi:translocation protein SEC63
MFRVDESHGRYANDCVDSIAGQMASLRGQPTQNDAEKEARRARRAEQKKAIMAKKAEGGEEDAESDYESGTDEDEESESETDTDTDSEDESATKKKGWW